MELSVLTGPKRWKSLGPILSPGFVTVCGTMVRHGPSCAQQFVSSDASWSSWQASDC